MPILCKIDDSRLTGFSPQAAAQVEAALQEYVEAMLSEIRHIEEIRRDSASGHPEITATIARDATLLLQRGIGAKSIGMSIRIIRILAALLSLIVGMMYDSAQLQSQRYMFEFILVFAAAMLFTMLSIIKE